MQNQELISTEKLFAQIDLRYKNFIEELILARFRFLAPIAILLHMAFYLIDRMAYPNFASIFLWIRGVDSLLIVAFIALSFLNTRRSDIVWYVDIIAVIMVAGISLMVYFTDGSSSRYYEGVNLIFLGMGFINSYHPKHNLWTALVCMAIYEAAMLCSPTHFNQTNFYFANYFMASIIFFLVIMTKFYRTQHYQAFVQEERLKLSEAKLENLYAHADKLSKTDELTEINNRRYFFELLQKKIESCEHAETSFYLIIFDVDHFKEFNDRYGHSFGDSVLVKVVEIVKKHIRPYDFLGRYGGDEFIMCMDHLDHDAILKRLALISESIKSMGLIYKGQAVSISVSMGAAQFIPRRQMREEKLMELADAELFNVKKIARGGVRVAQFN